MKQVTVASSTTPLEIYDELYSEPYFKKQIFENQILNDGHKENSREIITISKTIADAIFEFKTSTFVGQESELGSAEPEALCCGAT